MNLKVLKIRYNEQYSNAAANINIKLIQIDAELS
jgi:hypothetical protein